MSGFPSTGRSHDEIMGDLRALRGDDVRWQDGRTFGLVYDGGPEVHAIAEAAAVEYLHENALNTSAVPSLARIQSDVVRWTADLLHGTEEASAAGTPASGFMTSGGTESILCSVLASRERAEHERGVTEPIMVLASSAHAAFHKGAHLFGIETRVVGVDDDWRADVAAMAELAAGPDAERIVVFVASAPQYPQGVIDDVGAIAALADELGANCHVDACMGGFFLPFADRLGRDVPPFDFRVPGVTSMSADVHKLGYAPKGASVVLHRDKAIRRHQTFVFDDWLGGFYASPNLQGTRSGLPMAAAWSVIQTLGIDGYLDLTARSLETADRVRAGVAATPGIRTLGDGCFQLVAIAAEVDADGTPLLDMFAVGDAMGRRGWHLDRQHRPDSLHLTVSAGNEPVIGEFLDALTEAVAEVGDTSVEDRSTTYATID